MAGRPHIPGYPEPCTGDWACDGERHCCCWWDTRRPCCQCGDNTNKKKEAE